VATSRCTLVLAAVSTSSVVSASTNARFSTSTPGSIASTPPATPATTPTASAVYVKVRPRPDEFEARAELSRPGEPFVLPTTTLARPAARAPGRRRVPAPLTDRTGLLRSCDGAAARSGRLSARTRLRHGRAAVPRQTTTVRLARGGPGIPLDGWHQRFPPLLIDRRRSSA